MVKKIKTGPSQAVLHKSRPIFLAVKQNSYLLFHQSLTLSLSLHYKSNSKRQPMNNPQLSCCLCKSSFVENSQPRMMPYCEHSACSLCLKQTLTKDRLATILCLHCGHEERIADVDLEYFPKNSTLAKLLREKANLLNTSNTKQESSKDTLSTNSLSPSLPTPVSTLQSDFCQEHKKKLEIICLNDRVKLCAHCALFGSHRDHKFKTIHQVSQVTESRQRQFQTYRAKKVALDSKISSEEFKENIVTKIGKEKDRLVSDIKRKFAIIAENVKLAEKKAYEEVVKNFKAIYAKITTLIKEENDSQKRYKLWEVKCSELFDKAQGMQRIQDKAVMYCDGPLQICSEGDSLLHRLQTKINNNISTIETLISQIRIVQNPTIANSVFNYINVLLDDSSSFDELGFVQQEVLTAREEKQEVRKSVKIEFGADHLTPQRVAVSPTPKNKSTSKDGARMERRSSVKTVSTPQRSSVGTIIEQFCQRDNLDTLDLTGYSLSDMKIYDILLYLKPIKKVKGLKLVKNRLSNEGLGKIFEVIPHVTNLNLSFNLLTDDAMIALLDSRPKIPFLRIINLSNNKINERRTKNAIDELKKQGLIVTI